MCWYFLSLTWPKERVFPRGFYICTNNIWDDKSWSDPVYFDNPGFDQDVSSGVVQHSTNCVLTYLVILG